MSKDYYNKETKIPIIPFDYDEEIKELKYIMDTNNLAKNLTHLTFKDYFNQPVDNLPLSLTYLNFGRDFNQPVDNLPKNLTHLTFGCYFNKLIDNLPKNLTHLTFGWYFNQSVDKLPKNLTHLTLSGIFNQPVNYLPESLIVLKLFCDIIIEIPKNVKELHINSSNFLLNNLPYNIEKLFIKYWVDRKINNLPSTLKEIIIHDFIGDEVMKNITIPFGSIVSIKTCLFNFN
jgi:hypothetical protein